jgi:hypothetical protein
MSRFLSFLATALLLVGTQAFVPVQPRTLFGIQQKQQTTIERNMGLFDFFSEDARKEREERRQREIEEQERLQAQILARRADPEKMADYQARVAVRRRAIMAGQDGSKIKVMVDNDADE